MHVMSPPELQSRRHFFPSTIILLFFNDTGDDSFEPLVYQLHRMHSFWGLCTDIARMGAGLAFWGQHSRWRIQGDDSGFLLARLFATLSAIGLLPDLR